MKAGALTLVIAVLAIFPAASHAAVFNVTTTDDEADAGACTAGDPDCSLREAVIAANAASSDDSINLGAQPHGLSIAGSDDTAATGDLDIADNGTLTIDGAGPGATTVDGNDVDRVFHVLSGATATIRDLTIVDGMGSGGGIFNSDGNLTIDNVVLRSNTGTALLASGDGVTTVRNSTFDDNDGSFGGGFEIENQTTGTVTNSTFTSNDATSAGGGILIQNQAELAISDSTFTNNRAVEGLGGGAIFAQNDAIVTLTNSTLDGNRAVDPLLGGGALGVQNQAEVTSTGNTFSGNTSETEGGAVFMQNQAILRAVNTTFSGNRADTRGGVYANGNQAAFDALHVTMTGNSAGEQGGAINNDNSPPQSGPEPAVAFQSTIVSGNTAAGAPNDCVTEEFSDPIVSNGNNLGGVGDCNFDAGGDLPVADPLLGSLAANGGPTQTHALTAGSPAIDTAASGACPGTDQRGVARPQLAGCDIGAYELEPGAAAPAAAPAAPAPAAATPTTASPARPRVRVAGVRRACVSSSLRISVRATIASGLRVRRVTISVDGRTVKRSTRGRFATRIVTRRLRPGRHVLRITVTDSAGQRRTTTRRFTRCARRAQRQRRAVPRFTG